MPYRVLDLDDMKTYAAPGAQDLKHELETALNTLEGDGMTLAGTVKGRKPLFLFHHAGDPPDRMNNLR